MGYEKLSYKLTFYKAFFSPQWKFLIHTILQCLSANTTAWNEFSSTMASVIICLATNQKFNFSKYIFKSIVKNLENVSGKFLMYPRFVQVFLDKQLEGMETHDEIYIAPSHTRKIFGNMRRVGKGFSGRETPLFPTMMEQAQEEISEVSANPIDPHHTPIIIQPSTSQSQRKQRPRKPKRKDIEATPNEPSFPGTSSGGGPRRQKTMRDTIAQTRSENVSKYSNDPLLARARIESSKYEGLGEEDASKQGRIDDIDANKDIYLVNVHRDEDMFGVNDLEGDEVIVETEVDHEVVVETEVASKDVNLSVDEVTLAQALAALKSAKPKADKVMLQEPEQGTITTTTTATTVTATSTRPKAKGLVIHEEEQATTPTVSSQQPSQVKVQDKGKGIMVEEPLKMKKKDQISFDEQEAIRLQAEFDEEERLTREKDEANSKEENILQLREEKRKGTDLQQELNKSRRKHCTYLKNMEGWKPKSLKNKSFANIQELFDKAFKMVNTFVDYRTELMEESSKKAEVMEESSKKAKIEIAQESSSRRAGEALEQESFKKQKVEEEKESEELKRYLEIISDDGCDETIDATPLSTKSPTIVDYKIYKKGQKSYFQIIIADGVRGEKTLK
ncbi:hypothetical protein Tco_0397456 [Tanacetum coccineum]